MPLSMNMSGWTLLTSESDWQLYQQGVATALSRISTDVEWGTPPVVYPCLVASFEQTPGQMASSYVFPHDARMLLSSVQTKSETKAPAPSPDISDAQADHNKSMAAHVLSLAKILIDTGIITEEKYRDRHTAMLAYIDQAAQQDLMEMLADQEEEEQG